MNDYQILMLTLAIAGLLIRVLQTQKPPSGWFAWMFWVGFRIGGFAVITKIEIRRI